MAYLKLWFSQDSMPSLLRTEFYHPLLDQPRICVRGKTAGAYNTSFSFPWTSGVRALSALVLRTVTNSLSSHANRPFAGLIGDKGSLAASLDSSIGKQVQWLTDMFGMDSRGILIARRILLRSNPEGRRVGPIAISFTPGQFDRGGLQVYRGDSVLSEGASLLTLLQSVAPTELADDPKYLADTTIAASIAAPPESPTSVAPVRPAAQELKDTSPLPVPFNDILFREAFRVALREEIGRSLSSTNIFGVSTLRSKVQSIANHPTFKRVSLGETHIVSDIDLSLNCSSRLGMSNSFDTKKLLPSSDRPLKIATSADLVGGLSVLLYMKQHYGSEVEVNYRFASTADILESLRNGELDDTCDGCIFDIATAAEFFGLKHKPPFFPFMLMPAVSYRMVSTQPEIDVRMDSGTYYLTTERVSTASFVFEDVLRRFEVRPTDVRVEHCEVDEFLQLFQPGLVDRKGVVGFPHHFFCAEVNQCFFLADNLLDMRDTFLFISNKHKQNVRELHHFNASVRDAWLNLRNRPSLIDKLSTELVNSREFLNYCSRVGGFYALEVSQAHEALTA